MYVEKALTFYFCQSLSGDKSYFSFVLLNKEKTSNAERPR